MERSTVGIKLCLRVTFLLATSAALVAAAAPPAALEAPPALRLCIETLGIHGGYVPVQMAAVMLLAADHVKEGNCTLLPGGECPPGMGPLPGLVVTLYDTKLKPALGLESARKCKTEAEGHIYVLSLTQDVHVVSPVNSMNDLVTASASATEDVLGDDLFHPHLIRVRPGSSQMARKITEFIHSIGWKQVAILYAKDATGMSYGPEITGFAADLGIATTSVVLNGANPNATYSSLADLRAQGIKVILSLFTPKEMFNIFPVAKELGLFEPEYTWLGAGDGIANPKAMVGRSPDPELMAEMLNGVLVFTTAAKATPGTAALGQHAKQRGVEELYDLFDPNITDTVTRGMELPFTSTLLFHSYELIWLLAKGHTASAQSPAGAEDASYADRFVSAVTAENFSVEGLTGLIKLDQRRGRQVQDGDFEFHVHQISNTSSLQLLGMVENASFALDDSVSSFMWRDGSYFPEDVPSDGSKESDATADGDDKYHQNIALIVGLAVVGAILAFAVVCLFVLFRRVKGRLRWMEDNSGDSAYRLNLHSPAAEAADVLTILSDSYLLSAKLRKRAWGAARDLLSSNDPHAPMIQDISQDGGGMSSDHQFAADRQKLRDMARHFLTQTTNNTTDTTRMLGEFIQASHGKLLLSSGTKSDSRRDSGAPTDEEVRGLCTLLANAERSHPELLAQLGVRMSINIFDIYETCEEQPLVLSAITIIRRFDLIRTLRLNEHKLILFLKKVEMGYDSTNPYHNNIHAADVLNRLACILSAEGLFFDGSHASGCILLSAIIAAAVHDYGHPGMNNDCEVAFDTPASRQFNEVAVLEMQSAFETLQMLRDDSRLDFMENLPSRMRRSVMSHVIHLVLATDMKRHFAMIGEFKSTITQKFGNKVSTTKQPPVSSPTGQGADKKAGIMMKRVTSGAKRAADAPVDAQPASSPNLNSLLGSARSWLEQTTTRGKDETGQVGVDLQSWSEAEKTLVLALAIKVADIGHSFLPWELHKQWSARLEEEFYSQGQRYVEAGMDPPMLMDPAKPSVTEPVNQIAFYNIIALPLLNTWAEVFKASGQQLQAYANINVGNWQQAAKRLSSTDCSVPVDEEALNPGTKVSSVGRGAAATFRALVKRRNNNTVAVTEQPPPEYELPHVVN